MNIKEENKNCPYFKNCSKVDCDKFCLKNYKTNYYFESGFIPKDRRIKIPLMVDSDGSDITSFTRLAEIEKEIEKFISDGKNLYIYSRNVGNGKAQPDSSRVLTKNGFKKIKEIEIGDKVFGEDGNLHTVIGKFDRGFKSVYKLTFNDRTSCESCDEHLWNISDRKSKDKQFKTIELKELIAKNLHVNTSKNLGYRYQIPITSPLRFDKKNFILHPYILGYILGDAHTCKNGPISITIGKEDCLDACKNINSLLPLGYYVKYSYNDNLAYSYIITSQTLGFGKNKHNQEINIIKNELKKYKIIDRLSYNKEIPSDYLFSDKDSRIALLQGLMDTGGTVLNNTNNISYGTISKKLADQFSFLVQSLGGTVTMSEKNKEYYKYKGENKSCRVFYYCQIKLPSNIKPFRLSRKLNRFSNNQQVEPYRSIHNIEYVGEKHCYCIMTDNPSHLYLTDNCIVTHNTSWSLRLGNEYINKVWYKKNMEPIVLFISVPKFLLELKSNISQKSNYIEHINEYVTKCDLVIWDDIGSKNGTEFEVSHLLSIIDQRINEGKSNIYTSNLNDSELHELLGDRLYSRVYNYSECINIVGKDKRSIVKEDEDK